MNSIPFDTPLDRYASCIGMREYWDTLGDEWSDHTIEYKLLSLAGFVHNGGNLYQVIQEYADCHEPMYRREIQKAILIYLGQLMTGGIFDELTPLCNRVKCLEKEELVQLLSEELELCLKESYDYDKDYSHSEWIISKDYLLNDSILDRIERTHWRSHPDECFSVYSYKAKYNWEKTSLW